MILNVDKKQYGSVYDPKTGEELTPGMNGRSFNVVLNMIKRIRIVFLLINLKQF